MHYTAMFDTHAHLEMLEIPLAAIIENARRSGVSRILTVGSSSEANAFCKSAASMFPGTIYGAAGFDRDQAGPGQSPDSLRTMKEQLLALLNGTPQLVAIGETGLDFHYHKETASAQIALFRMQLELARETSLPIIIHCREAEPEIIQCLEEHTQALTPGRLNGLIHCFTGSRHLAEKAVSLGFMISFSGILTFKNADNLRKIASALPENVILVETDSPYLAPEPHRGRKNEPALLHATVKCLADARNSTPEHIAEITTQNALRLFRISN